MQRRRSTKYNRLRASKVPPGRHQSILLQNDAIRTQKLASEYDLLTAELAARTWLYKSHNGDNNAFQAKKFNLKTASASDTNILANAATAADATLYLADKRTYDERFDAQVVPVQPTQSLALESGALNSLITKHVRVNDDEHSFLEPPPVALKETDRKSVCKLRGQLPQVSKDFAYRTSFRKGVEAFKAGEYTNSSLSFQQCCKTRTNQLRNKAVAHYNFALALLESSRKKKNTEAEELLRVAVKSICEAIKVDPTSDAELYHLRGRLYQMTGAFILAGADGESASKIEAASAEAARQASTRKQITRAFNLVRTIASTASFNNATSDYEIAYRKNAIERTDDDIETLVDQQKFDFFTSLSRDIQCLLWRHLSFETCRDGHTIPLRESCCSLFLVISGTMDVMTQKVAGGGGLLLTSFERSLGPGSSFSRSMLPENMWQDTSIIARTSSVMYLTLDDKVYKYSVKHVFNDEVASREKFLIGTKVFQEWTCDEVRLLATVAEKLVLKEGTVLAREGDSPSYLSFVMSGMAKVVRQLAVAHKDGYCNEVLLGNVSSGDVYGESTVLDPINSRYPATVVALTRITILRIDKKVLNRRDALGLLKIGKMSSIVLANLKRLSVKVTSDKQLIHMIQSKCDWDNTRRKVVHRVLRENARARGDFTIRHISSIN